MREVSGVSLFSSVPQVVVIPTNGMVSSNGRAVMGAGVAKQAAERWPWMTEALGACIKANGLRVEVFPIEPDQEVVAFPTKRDWRDPSDPSLIGASAWQLAALADDLGWEAIWLPRVGCGLGGLDWETQVRPLLNVVLDHRFTVVTL